MHSTAIFALGSSTPALSLICCRHLLRVNGEKGAFIDGFANCLRCIEGIGVAASLFLPVLGGEISGRTMRGGAD